MLDKPDYIQRFYDIVQGYNKQIIDMVLEVEPDIIQYRGWYDTPDYWGTQRYKDILAPRISELGRQIHDGGSLFCVLLPEGYTLYKEILAALDVDVYLGLEPLAARKTENLAAVKAALNGKSAIWGGVNAPVTVGTRPKPEVDEAVKTAIETLGPEGFILNAAMYLFDDDVSWDRFTTFVNIWKKYVEIA